MIFPIFIYLIRDKNVSISGKNWSITITVKAFQMVFRSVYRRVVRRHFGYLFIYFCIMTSARFSIKWWWNK